MISGFMSRCLYKTVDFLNKIGLDLPDSTLHLSKEESLSIVFYNLKEYKKVYSSLLCPVSSSYLEEIVFCKCCSKLKIFMRNYALLALNRGSDHKGRKSVDNASKSVVNASKCVDNASKSVDKVSVYVINEDTIYNNTNNNNTFVIDEYLLYLEGIVLKDYTKLLKAIDLNPFFWDAYLELIKLTDLETIDLLNLETPLSDYFYMTLFVTKFITRKFKMIETYPNLLGAVYYHKREFNKAEEIFKRVIRDPVYFDLEYIDLYSNILYMNKDKEISILAQRTLEINKYRPETLCCIANHHSLNKEHNKAIEVYQMCIKLNPNYSIIYTLLGNEYLEEKEIKKAIKCYNDGIRKCNEDYRAWYNLGRAYEILSMNETALFFYKKSVEFKKNDFLIWRSLGNIHLNLNDYENAIRSYKKMVQLKESEGYMLIAEVYKIMKKYSDCVEYYEKYVNSLKELDEEGKRICSFLEEYFRKVCDIDKNIKYKEMSK